MMTQIMSWKLSEPAELPVQFGAGQNERRRTSVRTVMGIVDQVALSQKTLHFLRFEALARLNGRLTGHQM
jgi:hypothetical protein